jgi:hypothetical protein
MNRVPLVPHRQAVEAVLLSITFCVILASCGDDGPGPIVMPGPPGGGSGVVQPPLTPADLAASRLETMHGTYGEILSVTACRVISPVPVGCPAATSWREVAVVEQEVVENFGPGDDVSGSLSALVIAKSADGIPLAEAQVGLSGILFTEITPDALTSAPPSVSLECGDAPYNVVRATDLLDVISDRPHETARAELREIDPGPELEQVPLLDFVWVDADAGEATCN